MFGCAISGILGFIFFGSALCQTTPQSSGADQDTGIYRNAFGIFLSKERFAARLDAGKAAGSHVARFGGASVRAQTREMIGLTEPEYNEVVSVATRYFESFQEMQRQRTEVTERIFASTKREPLLREKVQELQKADEAELNTPWISFENRSAPTAFRFSTGGHTH